MTNLSKIIKAMPNIETLEVYGCDCEEDDFSRIIEYKLKKLRYLKIEKGIRLETGKIVKLFENCSNLRSIEIPKESICFNPRQSISKTIEEIEIIQKMKSSTQNDTTIQLDRLLPTSKEIDDRKENVKTFMHLEMFPEEIFEEICFKLSFTDMLNLMVVSKRFEILN